MKGHWASVEVGWAASKGIVLGRGENIFDPDSKVSRQEMAAMIGRFIEYEKVSLPIVNQQISFVDASQIADYAKNYVNTMQMAGIINGYDYKNGTFGFEPNGTSKRSEAVQMLYNMCLIMGKVKP